jgi:hypothetical protein
LGTQDRRGRGLNPLKHPLDMSAEHGPLRSSKVALIAELWQLDVGDGPIPEMERAQAPSSGVDPREVLRVATSCPAPPWESLKEALDRLIDEDDSPGRRFGAAIIAAAHAQPRDAAAYLVPLHEAMDPEDDALVAPYVYATAQIAKLCGEHVLANHQLREAVASDPNRLEYALDLVEHLSQTASAEEHQAFLAWARARHPECVLFPSEAERPRSPGSSTHPATFTRGWA